MSSGILLQQRIIFLHEPITTETANRVIAQLLYLEADNPSACIDLYINSPGGSVTDGVAIIDAMQCIRAPVSTICIGQAASMGAWILAAGSKGLRFVTPNAEVMIHQMAAGLSGNTGDIHVLANRMVRGQERLVNMLAGFTGQDKTRISTDMQRDFFMSAEEAKAYGIVDAVLEPFADKLRPAPQQQS